METLKNIKMPGAVWALLLVGGSVFLQANFEEAEWLSLALVVIAAIGKWLQVSITVNTEQRTERRVRSAGPSNFVAASFSTKQGKLRQWLLG